MPSCDRLSALYHAACHTPTDVNEHLPLLRELASRCRHVTEFGTRAGNSTTALLAGLDSRRSATVVPGKTVIIDSVGKLVCYDVVRYEQVDVLASVIPSNCTTFEFHQQDVLAADIEETDLLFIDTWHVYGQLRAELAKHSPRVRRWIVLHDTTTFGGKGETHGHRGLWPAVEEFLRRGTFKVARRLENNNGLTVLERVRPESEAKEESAVPAATVYLGVPWYGGFPGQVLDQHETRSALDPNGPDVAEKFTEGGSFHCRNFNNLWANALNTRFLGWTHFAMVHQDVRPDGWWLTTMLRELRDSGADLLSVVLPIKSHHGLTSTAVHHRETGRIRRLTMREVDALPDQTFDAAQAGYPGWEMLAGSGLWICDFTKPWVEKVWFETRDRVLFDRESGLYKTETISEDWYFCRALHSLGLKVVASKAVPAGHWGTQEFRNDCAWGSAETDTENAGTFGDWASWPEPGT